MNIHDDQTTGLCYSSRGVTTGTSIADRHVDNIVTVCDKQDGPDEELWIQHYFHKV